MNTIAQAKPKAGDYITVRTYDADGNSSLVHMVYAYTTADNNPTSGVVILHGIDAHTGQRVTAEVHVDGEDIHRM